MKVEHITRESLVDMFSSLNVELRTGILTSLQASIDATEEDVTSGGIPADASVVESMQNLLLMQECCKQAHTEFDELSKRV